MNRIPINLFLKNETSFLIERNHNFAKITVMNLPHLSKSELTVLYYLLWGMTVSEISILKKKKAQTISIQKKKLYSKLGVLNDLTLYRDLIIQGRVKIEKNI
ncbi:helix-turn-helix transcriptional regulator [Vagococcus sp. WN89Y]|uniref:helix-turn-helix transcriptional regulator n=1 Tax=Vagococcus sp. WN89Y TaxID=3457258 RepID=UPI003FCD6484